MKDHISVYPVILYIICILNTTVQTVNKWNEINFIILSLRWHKTVHILRIYVSCHPIRLIKFNLEFFLHVSYIFFLHTWKYDSKSISYMKLCPHLFRAHTTSTANLLRLYISLFISLSLLRSSSGPSPPRVTSFLSGSFNHIAVQHLAFLGLISYLLRRNNICKCTNTRACYGFITT